MNSMDIQNRLRAAGLDRWEGDIAPWALPAVSVALKVTEERMLPIGTSKVGGLCDLPPGITWPLSRGEPLTFIAQFNLAEVIAVAGATDLPTSGMLYFFLDERSLTRWLGDPEEPDGCRVLYYDGDGTALARVGYPQSNADHSTFLPHALTFTATMTITPADSVDIERLGLDAAKKAHYAEVEREFNAFGHQLLGYPSQVQGDMRGERALLALGLDWQEYMRLDARDPKRTEILDEAHQWRLLYQVEDDITIAGSNGARDPNWGGTGALYYWIHADALRACDFSGVRATMQQC